MPMPYMVEKATTMQYTYKSIIEHYETEFAHIFVVKNNPTKLSIEYRELYYAFVQNIVR